jgi:histidine ammonia-lyase
LWRTVLACELLASVRALRMRRSAPAGKGAAEAYALLEVALPAELADRPLTADLDRAASLVLTQDLP